MILFGLSDEEVGKVAGFNALIAAAIAALDRIPPGARSRGFVVGRLVELHDSALETLETEDQRRFVSAALLGLVRELQNPDP